MTDKTKIILDNLGKSIESELQEQKDEDARIESIRADIERTQENILAALNDYGNFITNKSLEFRAGYAAGMIGITFAIRVKARELLGTEEKVEVSPDAKDARFFGPKYLNFAFLDKRQVKVTVFNGTAQIPYGKVLRSAFDNPAEVTKYVDLYVEACFA